MAGTKTQEQQIITLLQRNLCKQWRRAEAAWSMSRTVAMFGSGAADIMDTVEWLQRYAEVADIKTQVLLSETLEDIQRDWVPRSHGERLSPASSADDLAVHCISTLRTVMLYAKDESALAKERSYRMTLRFNLDEPSDDWITSTFFVVCYASHDTASCARACDTVEQLARWRCVVLNKSTKEYAQWCQQSDGRAIGIVVNTAPAGAFRDDDSVRAVAQRYSFTYIETVPHSPTSVNDFCNRLLIAALRSVDAQWAPPMSPFVPRPDGVAQQQQQHDVADPGGGCVLWPFGWPAFLCRAPSARDETAALVLPSVERNGLDALCLSSSDFTRGGGGAPQ